MYAQKLNQSKLPQIYNFFDFIVCPLQAVEKQFRLFAFYIKKAQANGKESTVLEIKLQTYIRTA